MKHLLLWTGRLAGLAGIALCIVALAARLGHRHWLGSFQVAVLLQAGIALTVLSCLCYLVALTERWKVER